MNKYEHATAILSADPVKALGQMMLCLTRKGDRFWARFTHPKFTLEVRLQGSGPAQLVAPSHVPQSDREGVLSLLDNAVRSASSGRSNLIELLNAYHPKDWPARPVLRALLRANTISGGVANPSPSPATRATLTLVHSPSSPPST